MREKSAMARTTTLRRALSLAVTTLVVVSCTQSRQIVEPQTPAAPPGTHAVSQKEAASAQSQLLTAPNLPASVRAAATALGAVQQVGEATLSVSSLNASGTVFPSASVPAAAPDSVETVAVIEDYDFTVGGMEIKGHYTGVVGWNGYDAQTGALTHMVAAGVLSTGTQTAFSTGTAQLSAAGTYPDGLATYEVYPDSGGVVDYQATSGTFTVSAVSITGSPIDCSAMGFTCSMTTSAASHLQGSLSFDATDDAGQSVSVSEGQFDIPAVHIVISGSLGALVPSTPTVASIELQPSHDSLAVGDAAQLSATPRDSAGNALSDTLISWSSSAPTIVSVDATGHITGLAPGTATITASAGGVSATAAVTVGAATISSIRVTPATASIGVGDTVRFTAEALDHNGNVVSGARFAWSASGGMVASVDSTGLVTGLGGGTSYIQAESQGVASTASLTVVPPSAATLSIAPHVDTLAAGDTLIMNVAALDSAGNAIVGPAVSWSSSAPGVASVSSAGAVIALSGGSTVIRATDGTASDSAVITVIGGSGTGGSGGSGGTSGGSGIASLTMYPRVDTVMVDSTIQVSAVARDGTGTVIPTSQLTYYWMSSNYTATVDTLAATGAGIGYVTGHAAGVDTVVARAGGLMAKAVVTVVAGSAPAGSPISLSGRIVYTTQGGSVIANLPDFSDPQNLGTPTHPYWGPVSVYGSSVYLTALNSNSAGDVYRLDASTAGPTFTDLTPGAPYAYEVAGDVSPDGSKEIFYSNRVAGTDSTGPQEIWIMNTDGSGKASLTASDTINYDEQHARFSPDGSKIVFMSRQGQVPGMLVVQSEIYIMNADGTGRKRLTPPGEADDWPVFSPDGTKILFVSDQANPTNSSNRDLYEMNLDGTGVTRITTDGGRKASPSFSPNGSEIVYSYFNNSTLAEQLAIIQSNGTPVTGYMPQGYMPYWVH